VKRDEVLAGAGNASLWLAEKIGQEYRKNRRKFWKGEPPTCGKNWAGG